jgi:hypothetical protein
VLSVFKRSAFSAAVLTGIEPFFGFQKLKKYRHTQTA